MFFLRVTLKMRIIFFLAVVLCSCNDAATTEQTTPRTTQSSQDTIPQVNGIHECFMQVLKRDTFVAILNTVGDSISGKLMFDNYEKDGSTGEVHGTRDGEVLKLWYR